MSNSKDQQWFEDRVRENKESMFRVAYALLGNVRDCEDAASGAVLRAWQNLPALRDRERFRPWLLRILKNECYAMLRKRRPCMPLDEDMPAESIPDSTDLTMALSVLRPEARLSLVLFYVEGYSIREMAAMLDMSEGGVKSRLSRARAQLRNYLELEE